MQALLTTVAVLAAMIAFFEYRQTEQGVSPQDAMILAKVVRDPAAPVVHSPAPPEQPVFRPLNLTLPTLEMRPITVQQQPAKLQLLGTPSEGPAIRYSAELVYDRDKGEDVTGGKVNIRIPFG